MKEENVSIIIPIYRPNKEFFEEVLNSLHNQDYKGKIEIIRIDQGWSNPKSVNYGIEKAKYPIIVTLHQDCIPKSKEWLSTLVKPLENEKVVACASDVLDFETGKIYTPFLDEKGCAYKKKALEQVGCLDEETFLNSGDDMDLFMKLSKIGRIAYPHSVVEHKHIGYYKALGYKKLQNANSWGCLFRIYGFSLNGWWKSIIKTLYSPSYFCWFWRGFFKRKQDWRK